MIIQKGMKATDCDWLAESKKAGLWDKGGGHLVLTQSGKLIYLIFQDDISEEHIGDFEKNKMIIFGVTNTSLPYLLMASFTLTEFTMNPYMYNYDDRFLKLIQQNEIYLPIILVDTSLDKVASVRIIKIEAEAKKIMDLMWNVYNSMRLSESQFMPIFYRKTYDSREFIDAEVVQLDDKSACDIVYVDELALEPRKDKLFLCAKGNN